MKAKRIALFGLGLCALTAIGAAGFTFWRAAQKDEAEFGADARLLPLRVEAAEKLRMPFTMAELMPRPASGENMADVLIAEYEAAKAKGLPLQVQEVRAALQRPADAPAITARRDKLLQAALLDVCVFPNNFSDPPNLTISNLQALRVSNNVLLGSAAAAFDQGDLELAGRLMSANDRLLRRTAELELDSTFLAYVRGSMQMNMVLARQLNEDPNPATARFVLQVLRGFEHPPTVETLLRPEFVRMWLAAELYPEMSPDAQAQLNAAGSNASIELPESPQRLASMRSVLLKAWAPVFSAAQEGGDPEVIGELIDQEIANAVAGDEPNAYFLRASAATFAQTARSLRRSADQRLALAWAAEVILGERAPTNAEPPQLNLAGYTPIQMTVSQGNGLASATLWTGQGDKPAAAQAPGLSEDMESQQSIVIAVRR